MEFRERYYPTLCVRRGEMIGLEHLPDAQKDEILPIIPLAPWLNSHRFENTFARIKKSFGERPLIADIDRYYQSDSQHQSRRFYRELLTGSEDASLWIETISERRNYIPVVQFEGQYQDSVETQINSFSALGRGYVFRFETQRNSSYLPILRRALLCDPDHILIIFDFGWAKNLNLALSEANGLLRQVYGEDRNEPHKVVISCSNFPSSFSEFDNFNSSLEIESRVLFDNIRERFSNYPVYYGDWASTKPRSYDGFGSSPLPRIDFPTRNRWIFSRSKVEEWDYQDAAERLSRLEEWNDRPDIWGSGMIERTALGLPNSISTGPQNIAARINLHLFMQNNYRRDPRPAPVHQAWNDPI